MSGPWTCRLFGDWRPGVLTGRWGTAWRTQEVESDMDPKPMCFVIMPFSKTNRARTGKYWTDHYERFLAPLIEEDGILQAKRSKALRENILDQIVRDLAMAPVVVADLTDHNANVFWELGVRLIQIRDRHHSRKRDKDSLRLEPQRHALLRPQGPSSPAGVHSRLQSCPSRLRQVSREMR